MREKTFLKTILLILIAVLLLAPLLAYGAETMSLYLRNNYRYALYLGGALSVMMIVWSGVSYAISMGDVDSINKSKERLAGAIVGFLLLLLTYLIMDSLSSNYTVSNPLPESKGQEKQQQQGPASMPEISPPILPSA